MAQLDPGTTTDQFIYHFDFPGQPIVFIAHSNLVPQGTTVLINIQTHTLGIALREIHDFFYVLYGSHAWWAMDTAFQFDQPIGGDPAREPVLFVKQARRYPGWGQ